MAKKKITGNPNERFIGWQFGKKEKAEPEKHFRGRMKTSIFRKSGGHISYGKTIPLATFVINLLKNHDDEVMLKKYPSINDKKHHMKGRVAEEQKNVSVAAWIYASRMEDDNDFHIIIGSTPKKTAKTVFFNVEVSGLPNKLSKDYKTLLEAQKKFMKYFPKADLYNDYKFCKPHAKVTVKGSLFFDGGHQRGKIGPAGMKPKTVWEIHPVTSI